MKEIHLNFSINAPIEKVWEALTNAEIAEQWGAGPAKVDPHQGGVFSFWNGDIHGIFTKLIPNTLIEQDWYGHDIPDRKFKAIFELVEQKANTTVKLTFSGEIEDIQKDTADWQDYYFGPIKKLLEEQE